MYFNRDEKVFSLSKTYAALPYGNVTQLWEEFYAYLLLAGTIVETVDPRFSLPQTRQLGSSEFILFSTTYDQTLVTMVGSGLNQRYKALKERSDLRDAERALLGKLENILNHDRAWYQALTGKELFSVAVMRQFSEPFLQIAKYVAVAFGQSDFIKDQTAPRLYLSVFGNIHLSYQDQVTLTAPCLTYGSDVKGCRVGVLGSLFSAQIPTLVQADYPGDLFFDMVLGFNLLRSFTMAGCGVSFPQLVSSAYNKKQLEGEGHFKSPIISLFYDNFLYGSISEKQLFYMPIIINILDLIEETLHTRNRSLLFCPTSPYSNLVFRDRIESREDKRPALFEYALETLDSQETKTKSPPADDESDETSSPLKPPTKKAPQDSSSKEDLATQTEDTDPQFDDGGYDASTPTPVVPGGPPSQNKDNMSLFSADKTGEGVNEDLYRDAIVALNDRLRNNDMSLVDSDTKEALDYWVNQNLYRLSIAETKKQMDLMGLQKYLKDILVKG